MYTLWRPLIDPRLVAECADVSASVTDTEL
jgi:hypothetical protein